MIKVGVVIFPGSNCDTDMKEALGTFKDVSVVELWHKEKELPELDAIMLPGGFTYGDYLRCGAMARYSPVMEAVKGFADGGGLVMGVCNGFQILVEAGLLSGALLQNRDLKFLCQEVHIRVENNETPFTCNFKLGEVLRIPIAHYAGNFHAGEEALAGLEARGRITFRYCDSSGGLKRDSNPNGSMQAIAGITNAGGNVLGLMPHPERHVEDVVGGEDGRKVFESIFTWIEKKKA